MKAAIRNAVLARLAADALLACIFRGRTVTEGTDPVKKQLVAALSGSVAVTFALSGCDNSEETNAWAKKVCDQVQPQVKKIQAANSSIAAKKKQSPKQVKKTDSAAFEQISGAYKSLAGAVSRAGSPPVDNGPKLRKDAVSELKSTSKKYASLKTTVDKLDTKDQSKFAKGLDGVAGQLKTIGKSGDKALGRLQSGEVGKAMAKQKGCKRPANSPAASSSS